MSVGTSGPLEGNPCECLERKKVRDDPGEQFSSRKEEMGMNLSIWSVVHEILTELCLFHMLRSGDRGRAVVK
jgi:hypothetical protein